MNSEYYGVSKNTAFKKKWDASRPWRGSVTNDLLGTKVQRQFATEREAAIFVDKVLISIGKDPVNILKKVEL